MVCLLRCLFLLSACLFGQASILNMARTKKQGGSGTNLILGRDLHYVSESKQILRRSAQYLCNHCTAQPPETETLVLALLCCFSICLLFTFLVSICGFTDAFHRSPTLTLRTAFLDQIQELIDNTMKKNIVQRKDQTQFDLDGAWANLTTCTHPNDTTLVNTLAELDSEHVKCRSEQDSDAVSRRDMGRWVAGSDALR